MKHHRYFRACLTPVSFFAGLICAANLSANTCDVPFIDDITHQGARIQWLSSPGAQNQRLQYGTTAAYGQIQGVYAVTYAVNPNLQGLSLSGLLPNTTYHVGAQSYDGSTWCAMDQLTGTTTSGSTAVTAVTDVTGALIGSLITAPTLSFGWSVTGSGIQAGTTISSVNVATSTITLSKPATGSGAVTLTFDASFTTLPLPNTHPAYPTPPQGFDTSTPPVQTGATWTVGGNCPDFQTCLNTATFGDTVVIPAGTTVSSGSTDYSTFTPPAAPDALLISSVVIASGTITTATPHGFSNGQGVRFGARYGFPSPLLGGKTYYVVNPTSTSFQVASQPGGSPIPFTDGGAGSFMYVIGWPLQQNKWIVIRTSTPDSQLPPPGVRLDPSIYGSKLATIAESVPGNTGSTILQFEAGALAHHYWMIGLKFTNADTATGVQNTDPSSYLPYLGSGTTNSYIVVDRCYFHGLGFPNRVRAAWRYMDGYNIALINSYLDNITYWRPFNQGVYASPVSSTQISVAPGTFHLGNATCTNPSTATATITNGGGVNGSGVVYYDLNCNLVLLATSGMAISTTGALRASSTPTASVSFPTEPSSGRYAVGQIANVSIANGAFTGVYGVAGYTYSFENSEGASGIQVAYGPGPTKLENNYIEGTGIQIFWTDDAGSRGGCGTPCLLTYNPGDVTIRRNYITTLLTHMAGGPLSDGLVYAHRNNMEWKLGDRILIEGNTITNSWMENNQGPALILNPNAADTAAGLSTNYDITDVEVRYNTLTSNAKVFLWGAHAPNGGGLAKSMKRFWSHDNLIFANNGYTRATYPVAGSVSTGVASGEHLASGFGVEDLIQEHNTVYDLRGQFPALYELLAQFADGFVVRNNILWFSNDSSFGGMRLSPPPGSANVPDYSSYSPTNLLSVMPASIWDHNVIIGGWNNSQSLSEMSQSDINTIAANYPAGSQTIWPTGNTLAARVAATGFFDTNSSNFRLKGASPYVSGGALRGTDGLDIGANIDVLEAVQGKVSNVKALAITGNSASVSFLAPDSFGCAVDWTTNAWATFTRVANSGGARPQIVTLTGLPGATNIGYRVNCAVMQPTGSFKTH